MHFDEATGFPSILDCIKINQDLHVELQYKGCPIPLPKWFRKGTRAVVTRLSQIDRFSQYIRTVVENIKGEPAALLDELYARTFYKRGPPYSAAMIRLALQLRYTSFQAYLMLLLIFPFPSVSLLKKIQEGGVDSIKALR